MTTEALSVHRSGYALLGAEKSDSAHSRYNALVRRLVSFERAADAPSSRPGSRRAVHARALGRHAESDASC
jgi:hypothetical protein